MAASATFDPVLYKETTRQQWQEAAGAWHAWGPTLEDWLGEATELMLDLARVGDGDRVLDVAAGAGGQSLAAARRVGPRGRVLATDISSRILEFAETAARAGGFANVATLAGDGEELEAAPGTFDAAISRLGIIYMPERQAVLRRIHGALRDGGRIAIANYSTPDRNAFFSVPVGIVRRAAGLPAPPPGAPGPFSLGGDGVVEHELRAAGFRDVEVHALDAPLRLESAAECVRFERESFGALHQMLAGLPESERVQAWAEIEAELSSFEGPSGFVGPCELLVAAGTK